MGFNVRVNGELEQYLVLGKMPNGISTGRVEPLEIMSKGVADILYL